MQRIPPVRATSILSKAIDKHPAGIPQPLFKEIVIFRSRFVVSPPVHLGVGNGVALKDCSNRILGNFLYEI